MFGINRVEFREKQAEAIRRALKATRLTPKEIAGALGVDSDTFLNWAKGSGTLNGAAIEALDRLFLSVGYYGLIEDIYGELIAKRRERATALEREAQRLRATGDLMGAVA